MTENAATVIYQLLDRNLGLDLMRVTEAAALAAGRRAGKGDAFLPARPARSAGPVNLDAERSENEVDRAEHLAHTQQRGSPPHGDDRYSQLAGD